MRWRVGCANASVRPSPPRDHMAQWFDSHERAGYYLTDCDVAVFREHCDACLVFMFKQSFVS